MAENEANKTSSVVGYHIEMPANARLRSSGFVAFFWFLSGVLLGVSERFLRSQLIG
jgi:hypothetical protein